MDLLDPTNAITMLVGLVPNLLLILWAMARLSRDVRILYAKLSLIEGEMQLIDQGLKNVSEEIRKVHNPAPAGPGGPAGAGGYW